MSATIELKYFNSFWLKKMKSITDVGSTSGVVDATSYYQTILLTEPNIHIGIGQEVLTVDGSPVSVINPPLVITAISLDGLTITVSEDITVLDGNKITFGNIVNFDAVPKAYVSDNATDWAIEEARIRGGYNNTSVDYGVKAYIVEDPSNQQNRSSSLIYSGIYNSRTGINNTNQFSVAEDITRSLDPANGSIQKLYAEDTNLVIFQEHKVSRALIDKDAIYSAEGQPMTTSGRQVIGQVQAYAGEYGIATNPESFAVYGYRKYFTDRNQNVVLRLSQDGITEISQYGMTDFFRDNLSAVGNSGKVIGMWDMHNKQYVISMQPGDVSIPSETLSFDEDSNGWTSFFDYIPNLGGSLINSFYTFKQGNIWKHYSTTVRRGSFYGYTDEEDNDRNVFPSTVSLVLNANPSLIKNFNTINYEGSSGWVMDSFTTDQDTTLPVGQSSNIYSLADMEAALFTNNFKKKENKYFANLINSTVGLLGEVVYGDSMLGAKGFYSTVDMSYDNYANYSTNVGTGFKLRLKPILPTRANKAELYAVSSNYVESSY